MWWKMWNLSSIRTGRKILMSGSSPIFQIPNTTDPSRTIYRRVAFDICKSLWLGCFFLTSTNGQNFSKHAQCQSRTRSLVRFPNPPPMSQLPLPKVRRGPCLVDSVHQKSSNPFGARLLWILSFMHFSCSSVCGMDMLIDGYIDHYDP